VIVRKIERNISKTWQGGWMVSQTIFVRQILSS
jgi:hypothetical protein